MMWFRRTLSRGRGGLVLSRSRALEGGGIGSPAASSRVLLPEAGLACIHPPSQYIQAFAS